jgi:uncharacterized protein
MEIYSIPLTYAGDGAQYILYRPLIGVAFIANQAMVDLTMHVLDGLQSQESPEGRSDALDFLQSIGFLAPDPPAERVVSTNINTAVLLLTNRCHLRCTYCYAAAGELPAQVLPIKYGQAVIDFVCQQAQALGLERFEIAIHGGGEPTFAWSTLKSLVDYARSRPLPARISLTTNAIWSPTQRDWIIEHIDTLSVSMDGAPETQDRQRPLASGSASSPIVMNNIHALDQRAKSYGIRMTAVPPFTDLPRDVEFICTQTGCQSMQVEPAFNTQRGQHDTPSEQQYQDFAQAFVQAFDIAQTYNRKLYYSGARPGMVTSTFCSAPYSALAVAPSGRLVACYEVASESHPLLSISSFGYVDQHAVNIDQAARNRLHQLFIERQATCRDCFCYWSCAGDCFARTFSPQPGGHLDHSPRCDINRSITEQLLLRLIAQGDGVWQDPSRSPGLG